jgi:hypothetical protein
VKTASGWVDLGGAEAELFAPGSGFHVEHAGTTGRSVGRPAKGIRSPERIAERMERVRLDPRVLPLYFQAAFDYHDPNGQRKKHKLADLRDVMSMVAKEHGINVDARE